MNDKEKMSKANEGRDYSTYTWRMDAATEAKVDTLMGSFLKINDGMVIVDAGSGTGKVAEKIEERCHQMGVQVRTIALDLSHEYYEMSSDLPLIELAFGDAAEQVFADNSIDIKYYSTSGHEIASFGGGVERMKNAVENTFKELKEGGEIIIRDFVKPGGLGEVFMQLPEDDGEDTNMLTPGSEIDYSKLSTMAKFKRFRQEFGGGNAFNFETVVVDGQKFIKLDSEWAYEFYMRKEYTGNWRNEIHEKYCYWSMEETEQVLKNVGFIDVEVKPDNSQYMLDNWLEGKVGIYRQKEDGSLEKIAFPPTHMVAIGIKPETEINSVDIYEDRTAKVIDFDQIINSVVVDPEQNRIEFRPWKNDEDGKPVGETIGFDITETPPIVGRKFSIYQLKDMPGKVIKIPNHQMKGNHEYAGRISQFKSMLQIIERQQILEEYGTPHLSIDQFDSSGPPYRYFIQDALPPKSVCVADLILKGQLSEEDVEDVCEQVNAYESNKQYQIDTNPFSWYRVDIGNGESKLVYVSGKVYPYHDDWEFKKIGLLQWSDPKFLKNAEYYFAALPSKKEQAEFARLWAGSDKYEVWKKYLNTDLQPGVI